MADEGDVPAGDTPSEEAGPSPTDGDATSDDETSDDAAGGETPDGPESDPQPDWSVAGSTAAPGGRHLDALLWTLGMQDRTLIASAEVGDDGRFTIEFAAPDLQPGVVDFVVAVSDVETGRRGPDRTVMDALREVVLDAPLDAPPKRLSYVELRTELTRVLIERNEVVRDGETDVDTASERVIAQASPEAVAAIAAKIGVDISTLASLRVAAADRPAGLPMPVAYVLASAGLPLSIDQLATSTDAVRGAVDLAVAEGIVDAHVLGATDDAAADHVVALIDELGSVHDVRRPVVAGGTAVIDLLHIACGEVTDDEEAVLAAVLARHGSPSEEFWSDLDASAWRGPSDRDALRTVFWLDVLTLSSSTMVAHLFAVDPPLTVERAVERSVADWIDDIRAATDDAIPERFRTGSANAQRRAYATAIMVTLRRSNMQAAARALVRQATEWAASQDAPHPVASLAARLAADPDADVLTGDGGGDPEVLRQQRVLRRALTDGEGEPLQKLRELATESRRPPQTVARMGQRAFGGDNDTYRDAAFANAALLTVYSDLRSAASAPRAEDRVDLPDWAEQFGAIDDTRCEHCSSVYSPAAYLVDLLRFVSDRGLDDELLASTRRPDLESIKLDCTNTETPLPYIDLVNEILESAVLMTSSAPELPPVGQTTITDPAELRAHPEHLAAEAYEVVGSAVHPFSTPFDLWEAAARAYLSMAGIDRAEVRTVFGGSGAETAPDQLGLFAADLAILDGSAVVAPVYAPTAYKADANRLRTATGLSFDELDAVLATDYVRDGGDRAPLRLDTQPESIGAPFGRTHAERIHRLLLLARRLAVPVDQLDRALAVIGGRSTGGELSTDALRDLAAMRRLQDGLRLRLDQVADLFVTEVRTVRDPTTGRSVYDDWFGKPTANRDRPPEIFRLATDRSALADPRALVADNDLELRNALGLDVAQFGVLQREVAAELTLASMADLLRWTVLAGALDSSIEALVALRRVSGVVPFARSGGRFDVAQTERFVDIARALAGARVTVARTEAVLVNPVTRDEVASTDSPAARLAATLVGRMRSAQSEPGLDRIELLVEAAATELDLDADTARVLLGATAPAIDGVPQPVGTILLDPSADASRPEAVIAADRLSIAAALVRALALPARLVEILFDRDTAFLDPNTLPLSIADLSTERDRPAVMLTADAVVRAAPDGTCSIPLGLEVDGHGADPATVSWQVLADRREPIADVAGLVRAVGGGWVASVDEPGPIVVIATVTTGEPGRAPGVGAVRVNVRPHDRWPVRSWDGLLAFYQFHEGGGSTVTDISGRGEPLDLTIAGDATWRSGGGLTIGGATIVGSAGPATKVNEAVRRTGEITVEAWITPAEAQQTGPARIVTISDGAFDRNVTLGHEGRGAVGRFRTTTTGDNGLSPATTTLAPLGTDLTHLVYTRAADGGRLYIDGREVEHQPRVTGTTDVWDLDMHLALGGELGDIHGGGRNWHGTYHLVGLYERALSSEEVARHAAAGARPALSSPVVRTDPGAVLMLPWNERSVDLVVAGSFTADLSDTVTLEWSLLSGPAPVALATPTAPATTSSIMASTTARFPTTGEYVLGLRATDRRDPDGSAAATVVVRVAADADGIPQRWARFERLLALSRAAYATHHEVYPDAPDDAVPALFDLLADATAPASGTRLTRQYMDRLGAALGIGTQIDTLLADPRVGATSFGELRDGAVLRRIAAAASLSRRTGSAPRKLLSWADATIDERRAGEIEAAVRSMFERARWLELAAEVRDGLRERQRDALVAHLLARGDGDLSFDSPDALYGHFLIDVEMSSCQLTSRIKQAISSVQQFVQRTLLGIERNVELPVEDAEQWKWMKSYRLWEANRKVFLHPENWIEPELRGDKSPFFEELEQELAQAELDSAAAERAFANYLAALHGVSNLEIVGLCQEHDGTAPTEPRVLHLIGRSRSQPKRYWHRTLTGGVAWSPWRAIEADIGGDHVTPVFHNRRLWVFWAEFEVKEQAPANPSASGARAERAVSCALSYTELRNGRWLPHVISDGKGLYRATSSQGEEYAITIDAATGLPDFSSFSLDVRADSSSGDLAIEISFRSDQDMLIWPGFELPASGTGLRPRPGGPARLRSNRSSDADRYVAFGYGSPASTYLRAVPTSDPATGQPVPALTEGPPQPLTYRLSAWSAMWPNPTFAILEALFFPTVTTGIEQWAASHGWGVSSSRASGPVPRIFPTPPPTFGMRYVVTGVGEADKDAAAQWLRTRPPGLYVDIGIEPAAARPAAVTLLQHLAPPWTAVASRRVDLPFEQAPFVVQDKRAGLLVRPAPGTTVRSPAAALTLLSHPLVGELRRGLDRAGVDGLLAAPTGDPLRHQAEVRPVGTDASAYVTDHVPVAPTAELDFAVAGAYSAYHWELFFHVPFLIAKLLGRNQRFDEAQRWLHFIFDPTAASKRGDSRGDPWQIKPFRREAMTAAAERLRLLIEDDPSSADATMEAARAEVDYLLGEIHDHPFDPHVVARLRTSAYKKAVVMAYVDNLIAWADQLFSFDTLESINEAAQLYVMAADILGERPAQKRARTPLDLTRAELEQAPPPAAIARVLSGALAPSSATGFGRHDSAVEPPVITLELAFCIPANPRLLGMWDVVADRLYKVRHCQNIEGLERVLALFEPPIDPGALVRAAAAGTFGAAVLQGVQARPPHQRFRVLHGRAFAAADSVRRFGDTLRRALGARDSAALAELLSSQEVTMQRGTRSLLRLQKQEAAQALAALEQTRRAIAETKDFVDGRADETALEKAAFGLATAGAVITTVSSVLSTIAAFSKSFPNVSVGVAGISSPVVVLTAGGGSAGDALNSAATALNTGGSALSAASGLVANRAAIERQTAVFAHEKRQAAIDLTRIDKELEVARTAVAVADDNIATLEAQIGNVERVDEHLRARFTNEELWNWMVSRSAEIHFQAYAVALDLARRAERAFRVELGADADFVSPANWSSLRKGLLAGEGLMVDLTRMEAAYLDGHRREYELTLPVRLAALGGAEHLRTGGMVDVVIPETELDRRTPGHYMRRIKSVAVTVLGRSGPLAVPAKVTLLSSTTRVRPGVGGGYARDGQDDPRFVDDILATSIVGSGRPGDTGLFQRDYDDDRFLPFEGAGLADSHWRIDLFPDGGTSLAEVQDVELSIDYTAREGGDSLRAAAVAALR